MPLNRHQSTRPMRAAGLSRRAVLPMLALPLVLAACDTPDPSISFPELTFSHKQAIRLDVAEVQVINEYRMPFKDPNVEHLAPVAPGAAAERWATDVLQAAGGSRTALFVITRAEITEEKLKTKTGLQGLFSIDQSERYTAVLDARIDILDGVKKLGVAQASASWSQTAREDTTPNQRAKIWYAMMERLLTDFDTEMRAQVNTHLSGYQR